MLCLISQLRLLMPSRVHASCGLSACGCVCVCPVRCWLRGVVLGWLCSACSAPSHVCEAKDLCLASHHLRNGVALPAQLLLGLGFRVEG